MMKIKSDYIVDDENGNNNITFSFYYLLITVPVIFIAFQILPPVHIYDVYIIIFLFFKQNIGKMMSRVFKRKGQAQDSKKAFINFRTLDLKLKNICFSNKKVKKKKKKGRKIPDSTIIKSIFNESRINLQTWTTLFKYMGQKHK